MAVFIESLPASYSWPAPLHSWADPGFWIWGATYWGAVGQSSICGSKPLIMFANWVGGALPLPSPWIRPCLHCTALSVWPQPLTPKWTFRDGSLVFSNFFIFSKLERNLCMGLPQATFYSAELFCQATLYLAEWFYQAIFYLAELFCPITSP